MSFEIRLGFPAKSTGGGHATGEITLGCPSLDKCGWLDACAAPRQPLQKVLSPVADALLGVACSSRWPRALSPPAAGLSRHISRHERHAERALVAGDELVFVSVVPPLHERH